jgi:hypothetical protein
VKYDHFGSQPLLRLLTNLTDWPSAGPGWRQVAAGQPADVLLLGHAGSDPGPLLTYGLPLVVLVEDDTPPDLLDRADAHILPSDPPEAVIALFDATQPKLSDGVRDWSDGHASISALSLEASRIAAALARLAASQNEPGPVLPLEAGLVRRLIRLRRDRERHFPAEIFADPAWDMLLDLTASRLEGRRVAVSSLCIAAAVPTTTALRWIRSLSEAGVFERATDTSDARRTWISLSTTANDGMMAWLRRFSEQFQAR